MKRLLGISMAGILLSVQLNAQTDMETAVRYFGTDNIAGYVGPAASLYGADINAGMYRDADIPSEGFFLDFDIIGMGATVSEDYKSFAAKLPSGFAEETAIQPTILGGEAALVTDVSGMQYKSSGGIVDASLFSHGVAQLTVGSLKGTEAIVRFIATPELGDGGFPSTSLFGFGLRHSISQYMTAADIGIAAGGWYHTMSFGDISDITSFSFGAQGSKTWNIFTLYGGLAWEQTTMDLSYVTSGENPEQVDIEIDGDNTFRFTVGGKVQLGIFRVFADSNFGSVTHFSGGLGLGF
jgi:hypothetical protein